MPLNSPLFVARAQGARVYGDAGDVVTRDNVLMADISFRRPTLMWEERAEHPLLEQDSLPETQNLRGTYALVTALYAGSNYYHWLYNALPRLLLLKQAGIQFDRLDGILLNQIEMPAISEVLSVMGIPPSSLVQMNRAAAFKVETLWVMPALIATGHRRRFVCDWLREHFLPRNPSTARRRLYISRADAGERRMANEDELLEILAPLGFETFCLGQRSVAEQAALFAQAEIVVAPQGAGLSNLVFCAPGTRVIELILADRLRTAYWELSACVGLDYYYALSAHDPQPHPSRISANDTILPPDDLRAILKKANIL
jgi:capsular polysaccharide biosynthesis protein